MITLDKIGHLKRFTHVKMKAKSDLFQLIKSLTKSEKRYFKLYAKMHGLHGNQNYLILFDQIDKLAQESEEYNENKIK